MTDSRATLRGPIPPPMAASGVFLGLDPAHGQNEKYSKIDFGQWEFVRERPLLPL